ncbi:phosphatase phospho-type [Cantharellus anzutake]|uniref:phosphatase phospho-type n=1 Tax=Cantharellus anzutake TaxID=1750568 RepID=UPI0019042C80|nr:phosphatase phospho-type [Cantharellus anzutake]KAF8331106.1 phosphatase phospho-type [Cantharellus anzutake]
MPIQSQLVIFDFDWSLVDQDTDRYVFEVLAPDIRRKIKTRQAEVQWTDLIAMSLLELHGRGRTRKQIEDALRVLPFHPAMQRGARNIKENLRIPTTLICLSNANLVFIETILKDKAFEDIFEEIITNPAEWRDDGALIVKRRVSPDGPQHSCTTGCSANMCKGEELENYLVRCNKTFDRMIYVGDGSNDFCPILRFKRQGNRYRLCPTIPWTRKRIANEGEKAGLKASIRYWAGAWEVEEIFNTLTTP